MEGLTTGALAHQGGVNLETVRYYERRGLLPKLPRTSAGYRTFDMEAVRRLRFIKQAQVLGFSLKEIKELLALRVDPRTSCADVRRRAEQEDRRHRGEAAGPAHHEAGAGTSCGCVQGARPCQRLPDPGELGGARTMIVELIYDEECPNVAEARTNLRRALAQVGLPARWVEWNSSSPEAPAHTKGFGSPAVLVNGDDVAGAAPFEAACCRVYDVAGIRRGAPPCELIVRALTTAKMGERPRGRARMLLMLPAITVALVPGLTCPACWPAYAALLSALGLGFIPTAPYLLPLTVASLVIALTVLWFRGERRVPFMIALVASVVVLLGKFVLSSSVTTYTGVGLLAVATFSTFPRRVHTGCSTCAHTEMHGLEAQ